MVNKKNRIKLKKIKKNKGILFWITGLSGSGKTEISKLIYKFINDKFGKTLLISGDDVRDIFNIKKYNKKDRLSLGKKYTLLAKHVTDQKINVIFAVVGLFDELRKYNRKIIDNYVEVYIQADLDRIIKSNKKPLYRKKNIGKIWGINLQTEYPKKPDIIIKNEFNVPLKKLSYELKNKIKQKLK